MNRDPRPRSHRDRVRATGVRRFQMPPKHPDCGKRRCETYEQALGYLLWLARKSKDPLRIYECPRCRGFHLTKLPVWVEPTSQPNRHHEENPHAH